MVKAGCSIRIHYPETTINRYDLVYMTKNVKLLNLDSLSWYFGIDPISLSIIYELNVTLICD